MSADYTIKIIISENGIPRVDEDSWRVIYLSLIAKAVAAERQRCAGIVRASFDQGDAGYDGYHEALNLHLEQIANQIEGEVKDGRDS